ncbi:MBL fold metallo-hydrolase [Candidatus Woesearchaeota archaeon]|nr:MBL fold metallo-hydrolase [Candidatus Woesearchaeota archaeon]
MSLEVIPIGGFGEVGRNCVAVRYHNKNIDELVICDMGLEVENYVKFTEDEDIIHVDPQTLIDIKAAPDISILGNLKKKVKAICITHAHLDHLGSIPHLAGFFNCPVHGTDFSVEVIKSIVKDEQISFSNKLIRHNVNSTFPVSDSIDVEFISIAHSVPQSVAVAVHTPEGSVLYCNDFKFDKAKILGQKQNLERLRQIKIKCLIVDSLYAGKVQKTPSERVARQMLEDTLKGVDSKNKAIVVTTFSSHIARLKAIADISKQLRREPVFLGRSLAKYMNAAKLAGVYDFNGVKIIKYKRKINNFLEKLKDPEKYVLVVTGHQGEPKAVLARMAEGLFKWKENDIVVFSCITIPVKICKKNRKVLEKKLKSRKVRMFKDVHVSGHASKEDHHDLLELVRPEHIIPTHGNKKMRRALRNLAVDMGWKKNHVHLLKNGQTLIL